MMLFSQDGMLTAKIETKNEIYHIEPSWRHLQGEEKKLEGTSRTTFFPINLESSLFRLVSNLVHMHLMTKLVVTFIEKVSWILTLIYSG